MWDIFICHAWEDKEEIARPLVEALQQAGLQVWYDEFTLELGDSLRRSINQGLKASRYGVVILSPAFFEKEWPQKELDGLAAKERHGEKVILPVWHNTTYDDVEQYSPELADRLAVSTERGLTGVVRQILRVCRKHKARQKPPKSPGKQEVPHVRQKPQSPPPTQVEAQEPEKETKPKPPPQKAPESPAIHLRSEPLTVSEKEFTKVFGLGEERRPREYIQNNYEAQGDVVVNHTTGLMWQKSGSPKVLIHADAQKYVEELNRRKFAGYTDWRLPTIPELMSLLEPEKQSNGLYINPMFDSKQSWCWSADEVTGSSGAAWRVLFNVGSVGWNFLRNGRYVRCVRSRQQEAPHARQEPERETKLKPSPQKVLEPPVIRLRSEPLTVSEKEYKKVFQLDKEWRPLEYIQNDYEIHGDVVIDHATGLMWQKSGSENYMNYAKAQTYVEELNRQQFGGYNDWRLPTIPELMSLLEPTKKNGDLYIGPVFDPKQRWCWSADRVPESEIGASGAAWLVSFDDGLVSWDALYGHCVRCMRSSQQESPHARQKPEREIKPKPPPQKSPEPLAIDLRSEPLTVSEKEFSKVFGLDEELRPLKYIQNDYEAQGEVVVDHATGLMWQKSGSENYMNYAKAQEYVEELNRQKFAGYDDWRLPTIPELMSLLEPEEQSNGLYVSPVFGVKEKYYWCWSADRLPKSEGGSSGAVWDVGFRSGDVYWYDVKSNNYVRCVRSRQI